MSKNRERGIIAKKFSNNYYGFIHQVMFKHDIFFHAKDFDHSVNFQACKIGDSVSFELSKTPKGFIALDVKLCRKE